MIMPCTVPSRPSSGATLATRFSTARVVGERRQSAVANLGQSCLDVARSGAVLFQSAAQQPAGQHGAVAVALDGLGGLALFDERLNVLDHGGVENGGAAQTPGAFEDDGDGDQRAGQQRPHQQTTLFEPVNEFFHVVVAGLEVRVPGASGEGWLRLLDPA
jgi:hypothetical protein